MTSLTSVCLALACSLAWGAPKSKPLPKSWAKAVAPAPKGNPDVPAAGCFAELLDLTGGRSLAVGRMLETVADFQATAQPQGRVLITGGSLTAPLTQWFDPATRAFTPGPPMAQPRQGHRALLLKDGRILVVGGTEARTAPEILEPGATRFTPLAGSARFGLSADGVELEDGRVFLVDGASGQCFTWDPRKGFSSQGTLSRPRTFFRTTLLKDGKVLITGGWPSDAKVRGRAPRTPSGPALPVECFNPRWGTLSTWKAQPAPRARHLAERLEDGRVCLWAGFGEDASRACETLEILDPAKETVTTAGTLPLNGKSQPGWTRGLHLDEEGTTLREAADPLALLKPGAPRGHLASAYAAPTLVPLPGNKLLVLGSPAWGVPVDRWDPRTREWAVTGSLRAGSEGLALAPDGRVLSPGPVMDTLDPRTGTLSPLGWREALPANLKALRPASAPLPERPPFAPGQARQDFLVVPLDKTRALVVGGHPEGSEEPSGQVELWDRRKRTLTPTGTLKTRRSFPASSSQPQGALKLADGSVLVWGAGKS